LWLLKLSCGSSKEEIETIIDENIGSKKFDLVIGGDDLKEGEGKPETDRPQQVMSYKWHQLQSIRMSNTSCISTHNIVIIAKKTNKLQPVLRLG
jgi:hypothetical protein